MSESCSLSCFSLILQLGFILIWQTCVLDFLHIILLLQFSTSKLKPGLKYAMISKTRLFMIAEPKLALGFCIWWMAAQKNSPLHHI